MITPAGPASWCPVSPSDRRVTVSVGLGTAFRLMDVAAVFAGAYQNRIHQAERPPRAPSAPQAPRTPRTAGSGAPGSIRWHSAALTTTAESDPRGRSPAPPLIPVTAATGHGARSGRRRLQLHDVGDH